MGPPQSKTSKCFRPSSGSHVCGKLSPFSSNPSHSTRGRERERVIMLRRNLRRAAGQTTNRHSRHKRERPSFGTTKFEQHQTQTTKKPTQTPKSNIQTIPTIHTEKAREGTKEW